MCEREARARERWVHEVCRVYRDRLIFREDLELFDRLLDEVYVFH